MNYLVSFATMILFLSLSGLGFSASAADFDWMKANEETKTVSTYNNQYLLFRAGVFFPDISANGSKLDMNVSSGAEAGYGIQPFPWLAAEASLGFIETDDYDDDTTNYHLSVQMFPVTGTIRAILPISSFDLYALAGGGLYYTMITEDNLNQKDASSDDQNKFLFGYHFGVGASVILGKGSSMGIEARRIETSWDDLDIAGNFVTAFFRMGF